MHTASIFHINTASLMDWLAIAAMSGQPFGEHAAGIDVHNLFHASSYEAPETHHFSMAIVPMESDGIGVTHGQSRAVMRESGQ